MAEEREIDPRVPLAAERTLLAWIRTGLAMMGFGFVLARFGLFLRELAAGRDIEPVQHTSVSQWVGIALVGLGVLVNVLAAVGYGRFVGRYNRGELLRPSRISMGVVLSVVLALLGLGLMGYLLWLG